MLEGLGEGDLLIVGFGHNDEKSEDPSRFTDASLPLSCEGSFGYYLANYYVRAAREAGAECVLCTPIVRANELDDYGGVSGHVTPHGDYRAAVLEVGRELGVPVVDLGKITRERYLALGYREALLYHSVAVGRYGADGGTEADMTSVDRTHLNIYGASVIAYFLASELSKIPAARSFVREGISEPGREALVPNPDYRVPLYRAPLLEAYEAEEHFEAGDGWYGTAFGAVGGNPRDAAEGFTARAESDGSFIVGQRGGTSKGKIARDTDGFAFLFRPVGRDENFELFAECEVIFSAGQSQAALGLMLRDDCVLDQAEDGVASANYASASLLADALGSSVNFYREGGVLHTSGEREEAFGVGTVCSLSIKRVGQSVETALVCGGRTHGSAYVDFDFFARDSSRMYVGAFACRGTVIRLKKLTFRVTGKSQGA